MMPGNKPDDVIASRDLTFYHSDGRETPAFIRIGRPFQEPECWACGIHISNDTHEEVHYMYGEDSLQALNLALGFIASYLPALSRQWNGQFEEEGIPPFELGKI